MVEIKKGSLTLTVPKGAYDAQYAPAGWELKSNNKPSKPEEKPKKTEQAPEPEEELEEVEEDDEEVEYVDPEELLEKPLEELDFEELKIVAEYLGIDTKGMTTSKALKAAIKKVNK